jgi:hypothetical protein
MKEEKGEKGTWAKARGFPDDDDNNDDLTLLNDMIMIDD